MLSKSVAHIASVEAQIQRCTCGGYVFPNEFLARHCLAKRNALALVEVRFNPLSANPLPRRAREMLDDHQRTVQFVIRYSSHSLPPGGCGYHTPKLALPS